MVPSAPRGPRLPRHCSVPGHSALLLSAAQASGSEEPGLGFADCPSVPSESEQYTDVFISGLFHLFSLLNLDRLQLKYTKQLHLTSHQSNQIAKISNTIQ